MKKMLLATHSAGPAYYRMCSTERLLCSKQTDDGNSTKETITIIFFVSGIE